MSYYGAPPGAYGGQQPSYGGAPAFVPGTLPANSPGAMPNHFQAPPNMPANINWNASTIRLGVDGPPARDDRGGGRGGRGRDGDGTGGRGRLGLGASRDDRGGRDLERDRQVVRDSMRALDPPTREELARTIFVGGLKEGVPGDLQIEEVLRCAGKLRRWTRARDSADKLCRFGFAEYEDVESLEAANAIYRDGIEMPMMEKGEVVKTEEGETRTIRLLVVVDEASRSYIAEWKGKSKEDDDARQFRLDGCKEDLRQCLAAITNSNAFAANAGIMNGQDGNGDTVMTNGDSFADQQDVISIPVALEDELSDIPAEMRATVAAEIKRFRDRSGRKDIERMARDEGSEHMRTRYRNGDPDKLPADSNNIPSGPRGAQVPSGPKGYRGAQLPSDYANGVAFVSANGSTNGQPAEDEDDSEPDEEVEQRKQKAKEDAMDEKFQGAERRYLNREHQRATALARDRERDARELRNQTQEKNDILRRLAEWDDTKEERMGREDYYLDRSSWLRKRGAYRQQEEARDASDRQAEQDEQMQSRRAADDFLDRTAADLVARAGANAPAPTAAPGFKISLGNVAAKQRTAQATTTTTTSGNKRALADVEGLLEDEEDAALNATHKRPALKPISAPDYASTTTNDIPTNGRGEEMSDADRATARQALAASIPGASDLPALFSTPLQYAYLTDRILEQEIRPYCEKLVEGILGVREEMLVDAVVGGIRERKTAREIVEVLEGALDEEAEGLVRRVWRMGVFWGEGGARGIM